MTVIILSRAVTVLCEELFVKTFMGLEIKSKNKAIAKNSAATATATATSSATSTSSASSSATATAIEDNTKVSDSTACEVWGVLTSLGKEYMDRAKTADGDRTETPNGDRTKIADGNRAKTKDGDRTETPHGKRSDGDQAQTTEGVNAKTTDESEKEISHKNRGVYQCLSKACVLDCEMYRISTEIKQVSVAR